jgi:hypothetical protein
LSERYQIRVKGRMSDSLLREFQEFNSWVQPAETVLECDLDQAGLQGAIERLRVLGLELREVRRTPER